MEIRILGAADLGLLEAVAEGVFDDAVNPSLSAEFLSDPRHHLCVAIDAGRIVGFASAVHPDKPTQLWINEVGVADSHLKRGIGKAILERMIALAGELGCTEAWTLTNEDNAPARALYRSAGGEEMTGVVMMTFRAGKRAASAAC